MGDSVCNLWVTQTRTTLRDPINFRKLGPSVEAIIIIPEARTRLAGGRGQAVEILRSFLKKARGQWDPLILVGLNSQFRARYMVIQAPNAILCSKF